MEQSPEVGSSKKPPRRYAFACSNCRKKKIRCDGAQPECTSCVRAEEVCQYPKKRMEAQLAQAQKRIQELESELREARSNSPYGSQSASSPGALYSDSEQDYSLYSQVGFDSRGSITYHGPTSRFQESSFDEDDEEAFEEASVVRERLREASQRDFKSAYEYLQNVWQPSLANKTEADFGIPPDIANHLLSAYFSWQNPFHNFVYKPLFIKDLAGVGPYCSRFLLTAMFALAARHCNHDSVVYRDRGEGFLVAAKELLVGELSSPRPAIATIQGLLILGCRQCGIGNTSEGWLFSGMAFRMMTDIGLHLDPQRLSKYESLGSIEVEARKRLALAAYSWDKVLSLTLGRPPTLSKLWVSVDDIFDECDDRDYWHPLDCESPGEYRAVRFYNSTTFKHLCRLGELVGPVLATISGHGRMRATGGQIESIQNRLEFWYDQLPSVLRIDDPRQRATCPPPHILSLNLLYRTLLTILFRRYQQTSSGSTSMIQAHKLHFLSEQAAMAHDLFILYCRTFQGKANTYLISYCVYTVATVDVVFIRIGDDEQRHAAALRLRGALKILEAEGRQTPGIKKSVDIIKKQIKAAAAEREQSGGSSRSQIGSRQQSFDQAFAIIDPNLHRHSISGPATTTTPLQEYENYTQGGSSQYFGPYSGFEGGQNPVNPAEPAGWHAGGQHQPPNNNYNPEAFAWNYDQYPNQSFGTGAQMYGWPPSSGMS